MKGSFLLFAVANMALLSLTAVMGLTVEGSAGFARHFLLGVLSSLFTCMVHIVLFMYFVVQDKVMKQALTAGDAVLPYVQKTALLKTRALRAALLCIASILGTTALGAAIGYYVPPEAHLLAAFVCIGVNGIALTYQYGLLVQYGVVFRAAFPEE